MIITLLALAAPSFACGSYGEMALFANNAAGTHWATAVEDTISIDSEGNSIRLKPRISADAMFFTDDGLVIVDNDAHKVLLFDLNGRKVESWRVDRDRWISSAHLSADGDIWVESWEDGQRIRSVFSDTLELRRHERLPAS